MATMQDVRGNTVEVGTHVAIAHTDIHENTRMLFGSVSRIREVEKLGSWFANANTFVVADVTVAGDHDMKEDTIKDGEKNFIVLPD